MISGPLHQTPGLPEPELARVAREAPRSLFPGSEFVVLPAIGRQSLAPTGQALSFIHKGLVVEPVSEKPQRGEIYQPRATPWGTEVERYEP
jgi:hypothetical protein